MLKIPYSYITGLQLMLLFSLFPLLPHLSLPLGLSSCKAEKATPSGGSITCTPSMLLPIHLAPTQPWIPNSLFLTLTNSKIPHACIQLKSIFSASVFKNIHRTLFGAIVLLKTIFAPKILYLYNIQLVYSLPTYLVLVSTKVTPQKQQQGQKNKCIAALTFSQPCKIYAPTVHLSNAQIPALV